MNEHEPTIGKLLAAIGADIKVFAQALDEVDRKMALSGIGAGMTEAIRKADLLEQKQERTTVDDIRECIDNLIVTICQGAEPGSEGDECSNN
jgi:hypothetical protein